MSSNNNELGVRERITAAVLEATDEQSLREICQRLKDEGVNEGSIKAVVSSLRKKGKLKFGQVALANIGKGSLDELVHGLIVPEVVDGRREAFNAGVEWATRSILTGVRLAQELSSLGIAQAGPLIKMAQEMRPDANQIAQQAAAEAAIGVAKEISPAFESLKNSIVASAPNPMLTMMVDVMKPLFGQVMSQVTKVFTRPQEPGQQPGQSAPGQGAGFQPMTDEERKVFFGGE
jgi:hypothetical protein